MTERYDSDELRAFRSVVRNFAERECEPGAAERDANARFPRELLRPMAAAGLLGLGYPVEHGGEGGSPLATAIMIEELARVDMGASMLPFLNKACVQPWLVADDTEKQAAYIPGIASGDIVGAYAVTEPEAGSDVSSLRTRAEFVGGQWVLNGRKRFISNGGVADLYTTLVRTGTVPDAPAHHGMSFIVVPSDAPGLSVISRESKLGIRSSPTAELDFNDVTVPASALVGERDRGFYYAMATFDHSRPVVASQAVGAAQGALEVATRYVASREQFGAPLAEQQGIQWMLADMAMRVWSARLMTYEAHERVHAADDATMWAAMAKIHASDAAMAVVMDALQLLGGSGYVTGYPIERYLRDVKITQIYEGANQVLRNVVARKHQAS
jgi:alkylation response protein AidB-like acyl-CoA dehydrogenase